MCRLLASLVLLASSSAVAAAADWPTYLNGYDRVGSTDEVLPAELKLTWEYAAPSRVEQAWAGPRNQPIEGLVMRHRLTFDKAFQTVAAGGKVFFGSSVDHAVHCHDLETGKELWRFYTEAPVRLAPTIADGKVYFGSDDGRVYCLAAEDGSLVWRHRIGPSEERFLGRGKMISRWPVRTGVLIRGGLAYCGAGIFPHETVYLCALDAATGKIAWKNDRISQQDAGRNDLSPQGYLLASDELLFVPSGRSLPVAFELKTGEYLRKAYAGWRGNAGGEVGGAKALLADGQVYASGSHHFMAIDQKTGAVGYAYISGHELTMAGDKAFVATGEEIVALDRAKHVEATRKRQDLRMELRSLSRKRSSMERGEYQKQVSDLNEKMRQATETGQLWSTPTKSDSALIVTGKHVFVGGTNVVEAYEVETGEKTWSAEVKGIVAGLAAAEGHLLVSTDQGRVYAFSAAARGSVAEATDPAFAPHKLTNAYKQAAAEILKQYGSTRGFCLVLAAGDGQLALELAKQSELQIVAVEQEPKRVAHARKVLSNAGLYGNRVTILEADSEHPPLPNYFANLIVCDSLIHTGKLPRLEAIARHVKPCGGKVILGSPAGAPTRVDVNELATSLKGFGFAAQAEDSAPKIETNDRWATLTRGKLPGAGLWSHQYGNAGNTNNSRDQRIQGGLGVLWYGDPGPSKIINRHEAATAPLSTNGRMFIQGLDSVMCYDAYNGQFLWEYKNPGALRTGVFNNEDVSNLVATDDALFVAVNDTCTRLNAATGEVEGVFKTPESTDEIPRSWGYVAHHDNVLLGTSTIRKELADHLKRRGRLVDGTTDALFAVDPKSGERLWKYQGKNVLHVTVSVGDGRVYFIDSSLTKEQRDELLRQDKSELKKLTGEEAKRAEEEMKRLDVRLAVCVDMKSGKKLWEKAVDVTDCSYVGIGGGNLMTMYADGKLIICGANANGHYWRQFLAGEFSKRRLLVLDGVTGEKQWAVDADYRHRPIVVGEEIIAEPWSFDLATGKQRMEPHPLTGKEEPWQFCRPGHHCGTITAAPNMLFFRSGFTGYYDIYNDGGTKHFAGHRIGCWVNAVPGNGLIMIPESSAGCVCLFSIAATVVMEPREEPSKTWGIYSAQGAQTPVKHLSLNLGAPGDRRDETGKLWLAYPRPASRSGLDLEFSIDPKFAEGGDFYSANSESQSIEGEGPSWVLTSGARGLTSCRLPLLGKDDEPARYKVTLRFAELESAAAGKREFDIKLNGDTVAERYQIAKEAGGIEKEAVVSIDNVRVTDDLTVELVPRGEVQAVLSAIEVVRVD